MLIDPAALLWSHLVLPRRYVILIYGRIQKSYHRLLGNSVIYINTEIDTSLSADKNIGENVLQEENYKFLHATGKDQKKIPPCRMYKFFTLWLKKLAVSLNLMSC